MTLQSTAFLILVFATLYCGRRRAEFDAEGNCEVRIRGAAVACLIIGGFFAWELWSKLDDPFHRRQPETLYLLATFAIVSGLAAAFMSRIRITLKATTVIESVAPLWYRQHALSDLVALEEAGNMTFMKFANGAKLSLLHYLYSGVPAFIAALRQRQQG
jgi:hypothetical protein